jgi:hypothetical protein
MIVITSVRMRMVGIGMASALLGAAIGGSAMAYQTHMWNALHALQEAQSQLSVAVADKGGHREAAMNLVNQAIDEVNEGIKVGAAR